MKPFWQTLSRITPKFFWWATVINVIILTFFNGIAYRFDLPPLIKLNTWILGLLLAAYGFSRILRFHPVFNHAYFMQLALSPWDQSKALPRGPVEFFWADGVVLAFFMTLTIVFPVYHWSVPLIVFFCAYNLTLLASFRCTAQDGFILTYLFAAPLIVYPHRNLAVALAVLIGLTMIGRCGLSSYFKQFPWNTPWWNENQIDVLKTKAFQRRVIQWPFRELGTTAVFSDNISMGVLISMLFFIYAHVINWVIYTEGQEHITTLIYVLPVFFAPIFRYLAYGLKYRPPINLLGRFTTGRLIIPGYDVIYIAPVAALLAGLLVPFTLSFFPVSKEIAYELGAAVCLLAAIACPPNFEKWHYTGRHRIVQHPGAPTRTVDKKGFAFLSGIK